MTVRRALFDGVVRIVVSLVGMGAAYSVYPSLTIACLVGGIASVVVGRAREKGWHDD